MKLGNISQTVVPVPNFFMNSNVKTVETFNLCNKTDLNSFNKYQNKKRPISLKKNIYTQIDLNDISSNDSKLIPKISYKRENTIFRDYDILTTNYDLNINNNPRSFTRKCIQLNKEKYIPIYYMNKYPNMTEIKETYFPEIVELNKDLNKTDTQSIKKRNRKKILSLKTMQYYYNYKKYLKDSNIEGLLSPTLKEDIQNDTKNLIDKINMNYDIGKWNEFDTRLTFNRFFQTAYSPINDVNKNTVSIKDKFTSTLKEKALGLKTISNKSKNVIENSILKNNLEENLKKENSEEICEENYCDTLLNNCKTNLLKLKYNNCMTPKYNKKDQLFIEENEFITKKLNKTKLYKEFPSKTREEFNTKHIVKYKSLNKNNKVTGNIKLKDKYGKDDDNKTNDEYYYLKQMWNRPLHKDAFKLHE